MRKIVAPWVLASALVASRAPALVWPDVPERIERGLAASDVATRREAARDLATLSGARARPLVLRALDDADDGVRSAAAEAAIRLRIGEATETASAWLAGSSTVLRVEACKLAGALPDPRALPAIARATGDADATVRAAAAEALGAYATDPNAVPPLLGKLDDASPAVRIAAAAALARLGDPRGVVPLEGKVQDSVTEVRRAVARALGDLGDARAAQPLVSVLHDSATEVRVAALAALGKLRAESAVDAIASLTSDRNPSVRTAAIAALGKIGTASAVRALVPILGAGDDAGDGATPKLDRSPVRDALVAAGTAAIPELVAALDRPPPSSASSAAWVLGALHARDRAPAIVAALRRGTLPPAAALHALAGAGTSDSLPVALEYASDTSRVVRDAALEATGALLDPASPDGRAVEPLRDALEKGARASSGERASIARLLGRTGAARAAPLLASLARGKNDPIVRLAAIDALGALGPAAATRAEDIAPLLDAVDDADPVVRTHAAIALASSGDARARDALVAKLGNGESDDRAVLEALGGVLERSAPGADVDATIAALVRALDLAAGDHRDAVAIALGRAPSNAALDALARLATSEDADDRRTAATLLAAHAASDRAARASSIARGLVADPDASVRAQAAWSLGALGDRAIAPLLASLLAADADVAVDASIALGRVASRANDPALAAPLCAPLADARPTLRAAALAALSLAHARCADGAHERALLESDPDDAVRAAAALLVAREPRSPADAKALAACVARDRSGDVASRCRAPLPIPPRGHAVDVYVVPDRATAPIPHAPYVLVLADGALHAGTADRRGAVFDPRAPDGDVTLLRSR